MRKYFSQSILMLTKSKAKTCLLTQGSLEILFQEVWQIIIRQIRKINTYQRFKEPNLMFTQKNWRFWSNICRSQSSGKNGW